MQFFNRIHPLAGIVVLLAMVFFSCSRTTMYSAMWQHEPLVSTQRPAYWETGSQFDRSTKLHYAVSNDEEHVYVFLKTADRTMQMKMLRAGVQLGIDTTGGKNEHLSIRYPYLQAAVASLAGMDRMGGGQQGNRPIMVNRFLTGARTMLVAGFPSHESGELPHDTPGWINVNMEMDEQENLYFWAVIPVHYLGAEATRLQEVSQGMTISLPGIEAPDMGDRQSGGRPPDGIRINPDGGRVGAQPVGGPRPRPGMQGTPPDPEAMRRTQSFHLLLNLSKKPQG